MKLLPRSLFGSLVFSQCLLGSSLAAVIDEQSINVPIAEDIQIQIETTEKIARIAKQILSIPEEQMAFENTLGAWQGLIEQISLDDARNSIHDLGASIAAELQEDPELYLT